MSTGLSDPKYRVYIVDSHGLIRRGLAALIGSQDDMEICGQAEDATAAFNMIMKTEPHVVTTEITLSGNSGLELIKSIRALERNIGILVVSMCDESVFAERALRAGAHGFVHKCAGLTSIPAAIRQILGGQFAFTPATLLRACAPPVQRNGREYSSVEGLTDRELEVGYLIGNGDTTQGIATRLGVSVKTIETHRAHIKEKLGLPNGSRLTQFWVSWVANGENGNKQVAPAGLAENGNHANGSTPVASNAVSRR